MKLFIHCILTLLMVVTLISLSHFLMLIAVSALIVSIPYLIFQWRKLCRASCTY